MVAAVAAIAAPVAAEVIAAAPVVAMLRVRRAAERVETARAAAQAVAAGVARWANLSDEDRQKLPRPAAENAGSQSRGTGRNCKGNVGPDGQGWYHARSRRPGVRRPWWRSRRWRAGGGGGNRGGGGDAAGGGGRGGRGGFANPLDMLRRNSSGSPFSEEERNNAKLPIPPEQDSQVQALLRPGLLADVEIE